MKRTEGAEHRDGRYADVKEFNQGWLKLEMTCDMPSQFPAITFHFLHNEEEEKDVVQLLWKEVWYSDALSPSLPSHWWY